MPEYRHDPDGQIATEARRAARLSLRAFVAAGGPTLSPAEAEVFRRLGRVEAEAGRRAEPLQSAFRIAASAVMEDVLVWERATSVPAGVVAQFSMAAARFIDQLARLAGEGYAEGQAARARRDESSRLVNLLVRRGGATHATIKTLADQVGWPIPEVCSVAEVARSSDRADLQAVESIFEGRALPGVVSGRQLLLIPQLFSPAVLQERVTAATPGLLLVLGPAMPLTELSVSARLARRAGELPAAKRQGVGVFVCDGHLLELLDDAGGDSVAAMVRSRLGPLQGLTPAKRLRLAELLSAWLEYGGLKGDAPNVLDASRQTLSYRMHRLQVLFGDQLHDRDARLELTLALRRALPEWRAEINRAT